MVRLEAQLAAIILGLFLFSATVGASLLVEGLLT